MKRLVVSMSRSWLNPAGSLQGLRSSLAAHQVRTTLDTGTPSPDHIRVTDPKGEFELYCVFTATGDGPSETGHKVDQFWVMGPAVCRAHTHELTPNKGDHPTLSAKWDRTKHYTISTDVPHGKVLQSYATLLENVLNWTDPPSFTSLFDY